MIFLTDVSAYDLTLAEDNVTNRITDSVNLLAQIWSKLPLRDKSIILFLNKQDKLEAKVEENRRKLVDFFPDYQEERHRLVFDLLVDMHRNRACALSLIHI